MAMASTLALVHTPMPSSSAHRPQSSTETLSRHAVERHRSSGIPGHRRSSGDCRGLSSESSAAAGLSSSGRDGGACCVGSSAVAAATARSMSRSRGSFHCNAADFLGWRACTGGLMRLDLSGLPADASGRRKNLAAAVPQRLPLRIAAEKPDLTNVAGTLLRIGKQGLEAGTKLLPESVPRPVAQAAVGLAGVLFASFLLKSLFSTVAFILAIGALSYAGYFFLTKGESSSSSGKGGDGSSGKPKSTDEALEEARRIMDKYK